MLKVLPALLLILISVGCPQSPRVEQPSSLDENVVILDLGWAEEPICRDKTASVFKSFEPVNMCGQDEATRLDGDSMDVSTADKWLSILIDWVRSAWVGMVVGFLLAAILIWVRLGSTARGSSERWLTWVRLRESGNVRRELCILREIIDDQATLEGVRGRDAIEKGRNLAQHYDLIRSNLRQCAGGRDRTAGDLARFVHDSLAFFVNEEIELKLLAKQWRELRDINGIFGGLVGDSRAASDLETAKVSVRKFAAEIDQLGQVRKKVGELSGRLPTNDVVEAVGGLTDLYQGVDKYLRGISGGGNQDRQLMLTKVFDRFLEDLRELEDLVFDRAGAHVAVRAGIGDIGKKIKEIVGEKNRLSGEARRLEGDLREKEGRCKALAGEIEIERTERGRLAGELAGLWSMCQALEAHKAEIEMVLGMRQPGAPEDSVTAAKRLVSSHDKALETLRRLGPRDMNDLPSLARTIIDSVESATRRLSYFATDGVLERNLEALATHAVAEHQRLSTALAAMQQLDTGFRRYLHFQAEGDGQVLEQQVALLGSELSTVRAPLRLALQGAYLELQRNSAVLEGEAALLAEALHLAEINQQIDGFLDHLEEQPTEQALWTRIERAFGAQWLHNLLRAELVLETYYRDQPELLAPFEPVRAAAAAFRRALRGLGKGVEPIFLLHPFPAELPPGWEKPSYNADQRLRRLPTVRRRVQKLLEKYQGFIIDIDHFRLAGQDLAIRGTCRAVVVSPGEWHSTQEV
ncbi:MAG: hypothetical protein HC897_03755 [Thermoanaerobaculia bacterium]|nr:hypothetical protein [Thermoanaerobaculia bacterium]